MLESLGILVCSDRHFEKVLNLCEAAGKKGVKVRIFLTHRGVLLTQDQRFRRIAALASISLCLVSFESHGLKCPVPGLTDKAFGSQARHAELIEECERYLVF